MIKKTTTTEQPKKNNRTNVFFSVFCRGNLTITADSL